uniref:DM2 domain-containing protein n=1 Tax=viral metagenome TaxID=1070528 RepID=A0A6C0HD95_9ZZZZ
MARTKKTSDAVESAPAPAPVVNVAADAASATVAKAPKVKKAKAPKEQSPVEAAAPVEVAAPVEDAPVDGDASLVEQSTEFLAKLGQLGALISSLKTEYRTLEKKWTRELKTAQKQSSKRKRKAGNRAPSGFVKPTKISDELAAFLGKDKGAELARTTVTKEINAYIRTNKLQDEANGRKINPDAKLAALLKLKKTDELTYFNLQKYMSHHFSKTGKAEESASA